MSDGGVTAESLRAAVKRAAEQAYEPMDSGLVVGPHTHDRACDLLGVPHGTRLTVRQMWEAADIEFQAMSPEQQDATIGAIFALHAQHYGGW